MTYKKRNSKGPSKHEIAAAEIESDMIDFWKKMAESKLEEVDTRWLNRLLHGENAGKFLTTGERYRYQGSFNQILIGFYSKDKDARHGPLIINRTEMTKLFDCESFANSPVVENRVKSVGSLFKAPRKISMWKKPDGTRWQPAKGSKKKYPTKEEISRQNLKKEQSSLGFCETYPVWSIADIYEYLPPEHKVQVDKLVDLRVQGQILEFDKNQPSDVLIKETAERYISEQGIEILHNHSNIAGYSSSQDCLVLPSFEQFKNPIVYLATIFHELAHSTAHLNERPISGQRDEKNKPAYAKEEVIAETTAYLLVKQFEEELKDSMEARPELAIWLKDYYANSRNYCKGWSQAFDFEKWVSELSAGEKETSILVKGIVMDSAKALARLESGGVTPQIRNEALKKALDKKAENHSEAPKQCEKNQTSKGLGM